MSCWLGRPGTIAVARATTRARNRDAGDVRSLSARALALDDRRVTHSGALVLVVVRPWSPTKATSNPSALSSFSKLRQRRLADAGGVFWWAAVVDPRARSRSGVETRQIGANSSEDRQHGEEFLRVVRDAPTTFAHTMTERLQNCVRDGHALLALEVPFDPGAETGSGDALLPHTREVDACRS